MMSPGRPGSRDLKLSTKDLSRSKWRDFERLFETHPAPGAYPCWCMYNHYSGPVPRRAGESSVARTERRRREKRELVERGCAHGILVYADGEPVGWCQYGLRQELPRIDNSPRYRNFVPQESTKVWRITCFVVDRRYRRRGVARAALRAALAAIRCKGGGLVEAFPTKEWGAYTEYRGTVSMFEKEGFRAVASLGTNNVLMRRMI
jgi:GNAT superfamily N-acetyltransferase